MVQQSSIYGGVQLQLTPIVSKAHRYGVQTRVLRLDFILEYEKIKICIHDLLGFAESLRFLKRLK